MDEKLHKVIVGLALENELFNRRFNKALFDLFSRPNPNKIKALYGQLINSENPLDRETAFWLEPALEKNQVKINTSYVTARMLEMETLLFDLLWRVYPESQRDFNDWLNYTANAFESLREGNWIDAKIFSSLAFQSSMRESVNRNRRRPELRLQVDLLQRETLNCFEEIKKIPTKLEIPKERLDVLIETQEILIELLQKYCFGSLKEECGNIIARLIQQFNTAQRYLMRPNVNVGEANQAIAHAHEYLERQIENVTEVKPFEWFNKIGKRMGLLSTKVSS